MKPNVSSWSALALALTGACSTPPASVKAPEEAARTTPVASTGRAPAATKAPEAMPPATANPRTATASCVKTAEKTCLEADMAVLGADECAAIGGTLVAQPCSRDHLMGVCTRYGKGPLESTVMARDFIHEKTTRGSVQEVRAICESTANGMRGKGIFSPSP